MLCEPCKKLRIVCRFKYVAGFTSQCSESYVTVFMRQGSSTWSWDNSSKTSYSFLAYGRKPVQVNCSSLQNREQAFDFLTGTSFLWASEPAVSSIELLIPALVLPWAFIPVVSSNEWSNVPYITFAWLLFL